jgi:single-stranded-DNA-specific exonuclease
MTTASSSSSASKVAPQAADGLDSYTPLVRKLLALRGITTSAAAELFLEPDYDTGVHDPMLLMGMETAVARICQAIDAEEAIVIYADYDADGMPAAVVLDGFFKAIGYSKTSIYVPHRHDEGYGLNRGALETLAKQGAKLLITVDCGIADVENVSYANSLGLDVIITDHHLPQAAVPPAVAIINPKQLGDTYPDKMLCGAAVAWKLVLGLLGTGCFVVPSGFAKWQLDMVGLATLSDMVPLTGENRVLAKYGLMVLRKSRRPGLRALVASLKMNQLHLTEDDIGYMITPRINAASRMGSAMDALRLLATEDEAEARELCKVLQAVNDERKGIVASMVKEIRKHLAERDSLPAVIVAGNPSWRPSLLGLAANSLVEDHARPVFLWGRNGDGVLKGSCRADGTADLVALMSRAATGTFIEFGGHAQSGGFSVALEKVALLEAELVAAYEAVKEEKTRANEADSVIDLSIDEVTWQLQGELERFAPFGLANPKPAFRFKGVPIAHAKLFGKEKNHSELGFKNSRGRAIPGIAFFSTIAETFQPGDTVTLCANLEKSMFRNFPELRLRIVSVERT